MSAALFGKFTEPFAKRFVLFDGEVVLGKDALFASASNDSKRLTGF